MKRGQITLFIIIALLVAVLVGVSLYINYISKPQMIEEEILLTPEQQSLDVYVKGCLESVAGSAVYIAGLNSGYLNTNGNPKYGEPGDGRVFQVHYYSDYGSVLSYVYDGENVLLRSEEDIEKMLSNYVLAEIHECLDFTMFEEQGWEVIKPSHVDSYASINADDVFFELTYPIQLVKGGQVVLLEKYTTKINVRFGIVYDKVKKFIDNVKDKKEYNVFNDCNKYATPDKLLNIYVSDEKIFWDYAVTFVDAKPLEEAKLPFRFMFAVKNVRLAGDCIG
ncbi:MAG: hypothetical protein U9R08_03890 [Nanoarchaeota archaeon]|nr:hypothetical protein [Nanoarchaeota archaeon]